ncbi:MAG: cyclodeaminase/cyclohydrolase family protein [Clostridia bacterium]|nr:cyclodeaminase/cyclohydrolase family protein [Clostridia bacterium]
MEKRLTDLTVREFVELTKSNAPAPGGGSAAALLGAVGTGLFMMTANLTAGRKKFADKEELMQKVLSDGEPILSAMVEGIDRDTDAFNEVMAALALPKTTDEEKAQRKDSLKRATKAATDVPFSLLKNCQGAVSVLEQLAGNINPNCVSDLGVAAISIKTAAQGAWLNVLINISGLDEAEAAMYRSEGKAILSDVITRADKVYEGVVATL